MTRVNATNIEDTATWSKFSKKLCQKCLAWCCRMPVEVHIDDLVRLGFVDVFDIAEQPKILFRRLKSQKRVEHYSSKTERYTLSRHASGDCHLLDQNTRRCTVYELRPDTCRNHPQIGPRPGYCPHQEK